MPKIFVPLLVCFLAFHAYSMSHLPISQHSLLETHAAIFDMFLPFTDDELDTTTKHLIDEIKDTSFKRLDQMPQLKNGLFLLSNLHLMGSKVFLKFYYYFLAKDEVEGDLLSSQFLEKINQFLRQIPHKGLRISIADLNKEQRLELFSLLVRSDVNVLRQVGFYIRMLYLSLIYDSPLGEKISGLINTDSSTTKVLPKLETFSTHLQYNKSKARIEGDIDAIIVGSGASGAVFAHELSRHGLKVLVVESGPMVIPGAINTISDLRFMEGRTPRLSEDGSIALLNGATVGGGTTVNLDMAFPPTLPFIRHRFHTWHKKGLIPDDLWTDKEIDRAYAWVDSIFEPRLVGEDEVNRNNNLLRKGAELLGFSYRHYQLNTYEPGTSPHQVYDKKSAFEKLLLPAMSADDNPITVLSDCHVSRVLIKEGRAQGIECVYEPKENGFGIVHDAYGFNIKPASKVLINGKNIVIAAGNLGSSAILLNSSIKNDNIGRGFVAHPFVSMIGKFDHKIRADEGLPSSIFVDHFMPTDEDNTRPGYLIESAVGRIGLWALLFPGHPAQVREVFSNIDHVGGFSVVLTDTPNRENHVEVGCEGKVKVHFHLSDNDKKRLIEGIKTSTKILFAAGATGVSFSSFESPLFQYDGIKSNYLTPDMNLDEIFNHFRLVRNQTALLGAHMMGGNKIGISPKNSVVNSNYQVWDNDTTYENLLVVDGSTFPGSVGANPMQTIYMNAKYAADRFLKRLRH